MNRIAVKWYFGAIRLPFLIFSLLFNADQMNRFSSLRAYYHAINYHTIYNGN
jgi:hypothetical protein